MMPQARPVRAWWVSTEQGRSVVLKTLSLVSFGLPVFLTTTVAGDDGVRLHALRQHSQWYLLCRHRK
jgi:hypothetical protein